MYILERHEYAWAYSTATELLSLQAVQCRLFPFDSAKDAERRIEAGKRVELGVLTAHKCTGCKPARECEVLRHVEETRQGAAEFARAVLDADGYTL